MDIVCKGNNLSNNFWHSKWEIIFHSINYHSVIMSFSLAVCVDMVVVFRIFKQTFDYLNNINTLCVHALYGCAEASPFTGDLNRKIVRNSGRDMFRLCGWAKITTISRFIPNTFAYILKRLTLINHDAKNRKDLPRKTKRFFKLIKVEFGFHVHTL